MSICILFMCSIKYTDEDIQQNNFRSAEEIIIMVDIEIEYIMLHGVCCTTGITPQ